jgi:hypothetical protein
VYLSIYYFHLVLFILGLDLWELFWRAGSYIFCLCEAPLCGVSGRYNLLEFWPGVGGGAVRVFSWALLRWVRYD